MEGEVFRGRVTGLLQRFPVVGLVGARQVGKTAGCLMVLRVWRPLPRRY